MNLVTRLVGLWLQLAVASRPQRACTRLGGGNELGTVEQGTIKAESHNHPRPFESHL